LILNRGFTKILIYNVKKALNGILIYNVNYKKKTKNQKFRGLVTKGLIVRLNLVIN